MSVIFPIVLAKLWHSNLPWPQEPRKMENPEKNWENLQETP